MPPLPHWLPGYLRSVRRRPRGGDGVRHLLFCVADHFEPFGYKQAREKNLARVDEWLAAYPRSVDRFRDADGRPPRHTFFTPQDEYDPGCVDRLARFCGAGWGEVEIHLHHRHDTAAGLREKLIAFRDTLHGQHGLLGEWKNGRVEGWKNGRMEGWKNGRVEGWKNGRVEGWKNGRVEEGKDGRIDGDRLSGEKERSMLNAQYSTGENTTLNIEHCTLNIEHSLSEHTGPGLRVRRGGTPAYGFVHGNWALCNARADGDWCGVNEELAVLAETGCYADFTFPSAPDPTQPRVVNAIYRARDRAEGRGQDRGENVERRTLNVERGTKDVAPHSASDVLPSSVSPASTFNVQRSAFDVRRYSPSSLILIQGPLALNWGRRKWGVLPRLENGDISRARPPDPGRADLWVRQHIHVRGRPEWVFVKVHTHGAVPYNMDAILGGPMQRTHEHLCERYNDGTRWKLHYVTTRELYNIARAAEDGLSGDPGEYRDYEIGPPAVVRG